MTQHLVRAKAFKPGLNPSPVAGRTYDVISPPPPTSGEGNWHEATRKMRALPGETTFSTWEGATSGNEFYMSTTGSGSTGSEGAPVGTISAAMALMNPGDTLYLRGGIYWLSSFLWTKAGTAANPITIASYPGEIAYLATCIQEAHDDPASFWTPVGGAIPDEYVSVGTYDGVGGAAAWIAASMVPIQVVGRNGLPFAATNEVAPLGAKDDIYYGGPCTMYSTTTDKFSIRLSHTHLEFLRVADHLGLGGDYNYTGETDPREIPMFVGRKVPNGNMQLANYVTLRDVVVIGGSSGGTNEDAIQLVNKTGITFDNIWLYPSVSGIRFTDSPNGTVKNCKLRGLAAPWSSRGWMKHNGAPHNLLVFNRSPNALVTRNELVDGHDMMRFDANEGAEAGNYEFSYNLLDNGNDDGLYMPGKERIGVRKIFGNIIRRCNQTFPTTGGGSNVVEDNAAVGTYIYRNLVDRRWGVFGGPPRETLADLNLYYAQDEIPDIAGQMFMTHGGDNYERTHVFFYHNIVLTTSPAGARYYRGLGGDVQHSENDVFNNIYVTYLNTPREDIDPQDPLKPHVFNRGFNIAFSFANPTWTGVVPNEIYANPQFVQLSTDYRDPLEDLRLQATSPAIDAGKVLDVSWPDVAALKAIDTTAGRDPTVGAIPFGYNGVVFGPGSDL